MVSVSIMGFSGMLNTVVLSEYVLDIVFRMKNPIHEVFRYAQHRGVVRICFEHCIPDEKPKMATIYPRSTNKLIYILDFIGAGPRFWCSPVWVKSKMTDICARSNNKSVSFLTFMIFVSL